MKSISSKEEKEKEKSFNSEINLAIGAQLERFGEANAEHFKTHSGLSKISNYKISRENDYKSQAGKSAEIKTTARTNAQNIIDGNKTRISRTDDIGKVNHPEFDHVEVDAKGNPILDASGNFVGGSQQKMHFGDVKKYDEYSNTTGKNLYEKYKNGPIDVPSDKLDDIKKYYDKEIKRLKRQEAELKTQGKIEEANKKKEAIARKEDVRKRFRDSRVSTQDAMEARKNHNISIAKDIGKIAHQSGVESAKIGGSIGGVVSSAKNIYAYSQGNKTGTEALTDTAVDTAKATALAYASGATSSAIGGILKVSSNQIAQNMSKGNTPALILQTGVILSIQTKKLLSGEINTEEFVKNIGQEGATLAVSLTGANLGAIAGTAIMPGVGTIVGGVVGGMVASIMSSALYSELQKSIQDTKISNQQREAIKNYCKKLIADEREYREYAMSIYDEFFDKKELEIRNGFEAVSLAIQNGENMNSGLAVIGNAFNIELEFRSTEEFRQHVKSGKTLSL